MVRPPGLPGRQFAAGAPEDPEYLAAVREGNQQLLEANARILHALEGLRRIGEDDNSVARRTFGAIRRAEELDVYLARGCDTLTVEVCGGVLGRELFNSLKRACEQAKRLLQQVRWPTTVTNHICYGVASLSWGGKRRQ